MAANFTGPTATFSTGIEGGASESEMHDAMKRGWAIVAVGATLALAGCSPGVPWDDEFAQYGQRITTISPSAGNTQAANQAIQTINPWPRYAFNRHISTDAAVGVRAVHGYENGAQSSGGGGSSAAAAAPSGGGGGASVGQ
jgi:hypothetical protein